MTRNLRAAALAAALLVLAVPASAGAAAVPVTAAGAAEVATDVAAFRTTLGTLNPNLPGTVDTGRREINWDGVPDAFAAPNFLPPDFFNSNSPRGVVFVADDGGVQVSGTPLRFGNADFTTFSAPRLFAPVTTTVTDVDFYVAGSSRRATVAGFGAVFTDVDTANHSQIVAIGQFGQVLAAVDAPVSGGDLSFAGVSFDAGERIWRVRIVSGVAPISAGTTDTGGDKVALDDFIYGEPAQPRLTIDDVTLAEDAGTATFTVTRAVDTKRVLTVPYATLSDGAAEGSDYTGKVGTLGFNADELTKTITVDVREDTLDEGDEAFKVLLLDDGQATLADGEGRAVITDNDPPVVVSPTVAPTPTPTPTPTPSGYDASKDTTLPRISISGVPRKCTRKDFTVRISVVEDGLASLRVKLGRTTLSDRATAAAVTERLRLRVPARALRRGKHKLAITARDRAGNKRSRGVAFRRC